MLPAEHLQQLLRELLRACPWMNVEDPQAPRSRASLGHLRANPPELVEDSPPAWLDCCDVDLRVEEAAESRASPDWFVADRLALAAVESPAWPDWFVADHPAWVVAQSPAWPGLSVADPRLVEAA